MGATRSSTPSPSTVVCTDSKEDSAEPSTDSPLTTNSDLPSERNLSEKIRSLSDLLTATRNLSDRRRNSDPLTARNPSVTESAPNTELPESPPLSTTTVSMVPLTEPARISELLVSPLCTATRSHSTMEVFRRGLLTDLDLVVSPSTHKCMLNPPSTFTVGLLDCFTLF